MMKKILLLLFVFVLCSVGVSAAPFVFDVYDIGAEWVILNWTTINETELIGGTCTSGIASEYLNYTAIGNFVDLNYLRLDTSNDPLTNNLSIEQAVGDVELRLDSESNHDSCLVLQESVLHGFKFCYDGSGFNNWIVTDMNGNLRMELDRDTGEVNFYNNTDIAGNLDVTDNITGNQIYGGMWYHNHTATSLNFAADGTFYTLFMTSATHLNGFTFQGGFNQASNLTAQVAGLYQVTYMAAGDGQNNHKYYTSIFINGVNKDNCEYHHKMAAGGDIITQTGTCLVRVAINDVVDVRTADIGGTGTGNYYSSNLNLIRIGD